MERLTVDDLNKVCYDPWELCGMDSYCKKGCHEEGGCTKGCHILRMYRKLAKYEDAEESGRLLEMHLYVGDTAQIKKNIINDMIAERKRQDEKWGVQNHFTERWATIIGEEYGEMCTAINEFSFNATPENEEQIYVEAVQVMATTMAMLECMEQMRREAKETDND